MARKNRDADYVACNFMWGDRNLTEEEFDEFVDYQQVENLRMRDASDIPGYVYDVHTWKGKEPERRNSICSMTNRRRSSQDR